MYIFILFCIYVYIYVIYVYIYVIILDIIFLFIACLKFENCLYRIFLNSLQKLVDLKVDRD